MANNNEDSKVQYAGPITPSTNLSILFYFIQNSHITATVADTDGSNAVAYVITTDFTLSGAGNEAGGTMTTITDIPSGRTLTIERLVDYKQETEYEDGDDFPALAHETALDKLSMGLIQLDEKLDRVPVLPTTSPISSLQLPLPVANRALEWNSAGTALENSDISLDDAAAAANAKNDAEAAQAAAELAAAQAASSAASIDDSNLRMNIAYNRLQIIANNSLSLGLMVDGWADSFNDETGIDTAASSNYFYDSTNNLYSNKAIDSNTAVYLQFDDQADDSFSTVTDTSSNAGTVTINGGNASAFSHETTPADVKFGAGAWKSTASASSRNLRINDPGSDEFNPTQNTNWTLSFFVKKTSSGQGGQQFLICNPNAASRWEVRWDSSTTDRCEFVLNQSGGPNFEITSSTGITLNTYTHYAVIRVGDDLAIYQDGSREAAADVSSILSESMGLLDLFGNNTASSSFIGLLDDVFITPTNIFSADPSDSMDTITVPTAPGGAYNNQALSLVSEDQEATAQPDTAQCMVIVDDGGNSLTPNTDIIMSASRDDGTTYTAAVLTLEQDFGGNIKLYEAEVDISAQPADKTMRFKIETSSTYEVKVVDAALMWA